MHELKPLTKEQWRICLSICEEAIDRLARERVVLTDPAEIEENNQRTREAFRAADDARKNLNAGGPRTYDPWS